MARHITAEDLDRAAARIGVQLTGWQRSLLVDVFAHRNRTGRWPLLVLPRRTTRSAITRVGLAALAD